MSELRLARESDVPALEELIAQSARALSEGFYSQDQTEAAIRYVFGVDSQLIADRTYFVIEDDGRLVACGGWSRRRTLFGADHAKRGDDTPLDPETEPARIRAFFVDGSAARRGLGRRLFEESAGAARAAGFRAMELAATLPGEPLYRACGFSVVERFDLELPGGVRLPLARMRRSLVE